MAAAEATSELAPVTSITTLEESSAAVLGGPPPHSTRCGIGHTGTAVTGGVKGGLPFLLKVPLPAAPSPPARPPTRLTTRGPPGRCCR